jgi:hypothetical protein
MATGVGIAGLRAAVDEFAAVDLTAWPDAAIADTFIEVRREIDRLEHVVAKLLAGVADRKIALAIGASSTPAWAQWRTGQRWTEARASLETAQACELLPLTEKAWAQGEISASAARTICRGMKAGHEDVYTELEHTLVEYAAAHDFRSLDGVIAYYRRCADALDGHDPVEKNDLHLSKVLGRWALNADLDLLSGEVVKTAIDAATDAPTEGDTRSLARRRSDALVRIARFFMDHEDLPIEGAERPHVTITISWETIMSWLPVTAIPADPTELGALLSTTERSRLLCDAQVARIILGPDSQPLDVGREHRTAPRWLRRAIAHRDKGCRYPGCGRKTSWCEAHHVTPWEHGGPTSLINVLLLCPYHHHVVHRQGWTNTFDGITYTIRNQHGIRIE